MLIGNLSNTADKGGVTGLALYNNKGEFIVRYDMPTGTVGGVKGDGYGYDIAINPAKNTLLTSSFAGWTNYMRSLGEVVKDPEAMKHFGATMAVWDLKSMRPTQVLSVPGAPLEIRWAQAAGQNWAVTAAALTSKIWLIKQDAQGQWTAKDVATIGDPAKVPLPVDISLTADGRGLWVNTFMDGVTHYFDLTDPEQPIRSTPAARSTWSPRAGTASGSTSPRACCRSGTRSAPTTSRSCAATAGTAMHLRLRSRWTSRRRSSAARIT
jgi:selenium-binding protein 1